jgi:hypothetical protein
MASLSKEEKIKLKKVQEDELDQLIANLGMDKGVVPKGKKTLKERKTPSASYTGATKQSKQSDSGEGSSSSSQTQKVNSQPALPIIDDPVEVNLSKKYTIHPRVDERWKTESLEQIAEFEDYKDGVLVKAYARKENESVEEHKKRLEIQQKRHLFPGLECLLGEKNKNKYYYETDKGYRFIATLMYSKEGGKFEHGDVFIGCDKVKNLIYHKGFKAWKLNESSTYNIDNFFKSPSDLFDINDLSDLKETGDEEKWEPANKSYSYETDQKGVVTFTYRDSMLTVYPLKV